MSDERKTRQTHPSPEVGYGTVAVSDDGWLNEHVADVLLQGLPELPPPAIFDHEGE